MARKQAEPVRKISRDLFVAVKASPEKGYKIAERAGIPHPTLSRILHGVERLRRRDPRVLAIAREVGVPAERAFAVESPEPGQ